MVSAEMPSDGCEVSYFLDLATPETWTAFCETGATIAGFRKRHRRLAGERVREGDIFLCYLTRLSRWFGVLQVQSEAYDDDSPRFDGPDPFTVRFTTVQRSERTKGVLAALLRQFNIGPRGF